jgi:hypothetical protein
MPFNIEDFRFSSSSVDAFFTPNTPKVPRTASHGKIRVATPQDLQGFVHVGKDTLVRLSQQDFWQFGQDQDGYYIERIVDDSRGPVEG